MSDETIIKRIQALLRMTEANGATPDEAANAAALAQKLLFKYNLEMHQVAEKPADPLAAYKQDNSLVVYRPWEQTLLTTLADFNFCRAFFVTRYRQGILLGKPENIEAVKAMYVSLRRILTHLADQGWAQAQAAGVQIHGRTWKTSFFQGANRAIYVRLEQQRHDDLEEQAEETGGRELVVVSERELEDAKRRYIGKTHTTNYHYHSNGNAYHAGYKAGSEVSLNPTRGEITGR